MHIFPEPWILSVPPNALPVSPACLYCLSIMLFCPAVLPVVFPTHCSPMHRTCYISCLPSLQVLPLLSAPVCLCSHVLCMCSIISCLLLSTSSDVSMFCVPPRKTAWVSESNDLSSVSWVIWGITEVWVQILNTKYQQQPLLKQSGRGALLRFHHSRNHNSRAEQEADQTIILRLGPLWPRQHWQYVLPSCLFEQFGFFPVPQLCPFF